MDLIAAQQALYGEAHPNLATHYANLAALYDRRQWHQITDALESLVQDESCWIDRNLLNLFEGFVTKFETKINPMRFVLLSLRVSRQHFISEPPTQIQLRAALDFVSTLAQKPFLDVDSRTVAKMGMVELLVQLTSETDNMNKARELIEEVAPRVATLEGDAMTQVKSSFYAAEAALYKQVGPAAEFYRSATQFLAHTPISSLAKSRRMELAEDICMAALVSDDVFNFGELLEQELMEHLDGKKKWLRDLLLVFHRGDVDAFNTTVDTYRNVIASTKTLDMNVLKQKIALCCLMKLVFERPPHQRDISFDEIAAATRLPGGQVEWLLMKAFAKNLVKGTMDEISRVVHVTYLQPRTLDAAQLLALDKQLLAWQHKVDEALAFEMAAPEMFS